MSDISPCDQIISDYEAQIGRMDKEIESLVSQLSTIRAEVIEKCKKAIIKLAEDGITTPRKLNRADCLQALDQLKENSHE